MILHSSTDHKHSITQPSNKWQSCEPTKRKHDPMKCSTNSERCRLLKLVKLCNYLLISCVLLVCLINGSEASSFGCSSNPCIFGVCIDDLNRYGLCPMNLRFGISWIPLTMNFVFDIMEVGRDEYEILIGLIWVQLQRNDHLHKLSNFELLQTFRLFKRQSKLN